MTATRLEGLDPDRLAQALGVPEWDVLIVSDGSSARACGWSAVLYEKGGRRKTFLGAMNWRSTHIAELIPCWQALGWYMAGPGKKLLHCRRSSGKEAAATALIVSDSASTVACGQTRASRKPGQTLWAAISSLEQQGLRLQWRWVRKDRLEDNRVADRVANAARTAIEKTEKEQKKLSP